MTTSSFTLTDAIWQIERALARGERLAEVVKSVSRQHGIEASLLTRRWVQFTPCANPAVVHGAPLQRNPV